MVSYSTHHYVNVKFFTVSCNHTQIHIGHIDYRSNLNIYFIGYFFFLLWIHTWITIASKKYIWFKSLGWSLQFLTTKTKKILKEALMTTIKRMEMVKIKTIRKLFMLTATICWQPRFVADGNRMRRRNFSVRATEM